jgi:hypothetical protein
VRLLFAAALCLAACKTAPETVPEARLPDARIYYPLAVGNSWTYAVGGSDQKATIEIIGRDGEWFLDDHRGRLRYEEGGVRDADHYLLRPPLKAGTTWSAVANLVVQHFEITSADATLVTQAGTFSHCIVVRNSSTVKKGTSFVTEWTFAPHVGIVQIVTSVVDAKGAATEQTRLGLVSFHVSG